MIGQILIVPVVSRWVNCYFTMVIELDSGATLYLNLQYRPASLSVIPRDMMIDFLPELTAIELPELVE